MNRDELPKRLAPAGLGVVLALASLPGCLCPPCDVPGAAAPETAAAEPAAKSSPVAAGARLVIWDGDKAGAGSGWADCTKKGQCKSTLSKAAGVGVDGSAALKFHGEGTDWIGAGWNWVNYDPNSSGTDISQYTVLTFQIRVESTADAPMDPSSLAVLLGCIKGKKDSSDLSVAQYTKDFADGKWHKVVIPISELTKAKGAAFDLRSAWQFVFTTWSGSNRNFTIYLDDLAVEKEIPG
jgi:hypothetical protein